MTGFDTDIERQVAYLNDRQWEALMGARLVDGEWDFAEDVFFCDLLELYRERLQDAVVSEQLSLFPSS